MIQAPQHHLSYSLAQVYFCTNPLLANVPRPLWAVQIGLAHVSKSAMAMACRMRASHTATGRFTNVADHSSYKPISSDNAGKAENSREFVGRMIIWPSQKAPSRSSRRQTLSTIEKFAKYNTIESNPRSVLKDFHRIGDALFAKHISVRIEENMPYRHNSTSTCSKPVIAYKKAVASSSHWVAANTSRS